MQDQDIEIQYDSVLYRKVGKVKEAHGIRGELYILIFSDDSSWIEAIESILLQNSQLKRQAIYQIEKLRPHKGGIVVKLSSVNDRNAAELLKGSLFYVPSDTFISEDDDEGYFLAEIEGFEVVESEKGPLGKIVNFSFNGVYDVLHVQVLSQEIQIPLVEDWIENIDFESKKVFMKLPEGIVEVQTDPSRYEKDDE